MWCGLLAGLLSRPSYTRMFPTTGLKWTISLHCCRSFVFCTAIMHGIALLCSLMSSLMRSIHLFLGLLLRPLTFVDKTCKGSLVCRGMYEIPNFTRRNAEGWKYCKHTIGWAVEPRDRRVEDQRDELLWVCGAAGGQRGMAGNHHRPIWQAWLSYNEFADCWQHCMIEG